MSRHLLYLAVLLVLSACGSPTSADGGGSMQSNLDKATTDLNGNPSQWSLFYSTGSTLTLNSLGQPAITFPTNSRDSVNMLTTAWTGSSVGRTAYRNKREVQKVDDARDSAPDKMTGPIEHHPGEVIAVVRRSDDIVITKTADCTKP